MICNRRVAGGGAPVPNPHFTGLALFDHDSMWFFDFAGGEMRFPDDVGNSKKGTPLFVKDHPVGNCNKDDTGHITWDGALVLAKYLELRSNKSSSCSSLPILVDEHTIILELGAGTGFVGFACAVLGAKLAYLTDFPYALSIAKQNAEKNASAFSIKLEKKVLTQFSREMAAWRIQSFLRRQHNRHKSAGGNRELRKAMHDVIDRAQDKFLGGMKAVQMEVQLERCPRNIITRTQ